MTPPKVLLLDVMGTLVTEPFFEVLPRHFGLSLDELLRVKDKSAWLEFERGEIDEAEYLRRFFADGRVVERAPLIATLRDAYDWMPGVEPVLAALQGRVPMYALSNYSTWYEIIEDKLRLSRYLDWRFVSCKTGVRKPDQEAYLGPARALGVAPSDCLFVDDREGNTSAAEALGMKAHRFESAESLAGVLADLGLKLSL